MVLVRQHLKDKNKSHIVGYPALSAVYTIGYVMYGGKQ